MGYFNPTSYNSVIFNSFLESDLKKKIIHRDNFNINIEDWTIIIINNFAIHATHHNSIIRIVPVNGIPTNVGRIDVNRYIDRSNTNMKLNFRRCILWQTECVTSLLAVNKRLQFRERCFRRTHTKRISDCMCVGMRDARMYFAAILWIFLWCWKYSIFHLFILFPNDTHRNTI